MSQSTKKEIQSFLSCIRSIIYKPNGFHIVDRRKNMKALTENNIPIEIAKLYIEKLKVKNYCKGPLKDKNKNYNHKWWIFGKKIESILFYIKIRINIKDKKQVVCLSFHPAKFTMDFPYS